MFARIISNLFKDQHKFHQTHTQDVIVDVDKSVNFPQNIISVLELKKTQEGSKYTIVCGHTKNGITKVLNKYTILYYAKKYLLCSCSCGGGGYGHNQCEHIKHIKHMIEKEKLPIETQTKQQTNQQTKQQKISVTLVHTTHKSNKLLQKYDVMVDGNNVYNVCKHSNINDEDDENDNDNDHDEHTYYCSCHSSSNACLHIGSVIAQIQKKTKK